MNYLIMVLLIFSCQLLAQYSFNNADELKPFEKVELHGERGISVTATIENNPNRLFDSTTTVDSLILMDERDTIKYCFEYDSIGRMKTEIEKELESNKWENKHRITTIYNNEEQIDSTIYESWGYEDWDISNTISYTYNIDGNLIQEHDASGKRFIYEYDENSMLKLELYERKDQGEWVNQRRFLYEYEMGYLSSKKVEIWENNAWINGNLKTFEYDSSGNMIKFKYQIWENEQWLNDQLYIYEYDERGNRTLELIQWWVEVEWSSGYREMMTYTNFDKLKTKEMQYWYSGDTSWSNRQIDSLVYDANENNVQRLVIDWHFDEWVYFTNFDMTYDGNNNRTSIMRSSWEENQWVNQQIDTYDYASNSDLLSAISKYWENNQWVMGWSGFSFFDSFGREYGYTGSELIIFYSNFTDIEKEEFIVRNFELHQNYPNPFNPNTTISYSIPEITHVELMVYDVLGRVVTKLVNKEQLGGNYEVKFDASSLTSGVYFYRLQAGSFIESKKMTLIK